MPAQPHPCSVAGTRLLREPRQAERRGATGPVLPVLVGIVPGPCSQPVVDAGPGGRALNLPLSLSVCKMGCESQTDGVRIQGDGEARAAFPEWRGGRQRARPSPSPLSVEKPPPSLGSRARKLQEGPLLGQSRGVNRLWLPQAQRPWQNSALHGLAGGEVSAALCPCCPGRFLGPSESKWLSPPREWPGAGQAGRPRQAVSLRGLGADGHLCPGSAPPIGSCRDPQLGRRAGWVGPVCCPAHVPKAWIPGIPGAAGTPRFVACSKRVTDLTTPELGVSLCPTICSVCSLGCSGGPSVSSACLAPGSLPVTSIE